MISKFTLGATEWSVEEVEKFDSTTQLGESSIGETKIRISKTWSNTLVSEQSKEATIYHEVVHAILDTLGEFDLSQKEEFVQKFSVLMHQFEKTKL
jgi:hypothetical protein